MICTSHVTNPPATNRTSVYTDASVRGDLSAVAWFVSPHHFGALVLPAMPTHAAEAYGALEALQHVPTPALLVTDDHSLALSLQRPRGAIDVDRRELHRVVREQNVRVCCVPGHGKNTPRQLRFCDVLSRALTRSAERLDLRPGDLFVAVGSPCADFDAPRTWALPDSPSKTAFGLFKHVQTEIRLALGDEPHRYQYPWK